MTSIAESLPAPTQLASVLAAGVAQISNQQTLTFIQYTLVVLPLDGWRFWVKSSLLVTPPAVAPAPLTVLGSLHFATTSRNNEDETIAVNRVVVTSTAKIQDFNAVSPTTIYIATFGEIRFAFSQRKSFYKQAQLWHYEGDAIYPEMEQMIIDDLSQFDQSDVIVSNSLPIWLAMLTPAAWPQPPIPTFPLFPSFAVPDNFPPPYATVHIVPDQTNAFQAAPNFPDVTQSSYQLAVDQVRVTLYGVRNNDALDFQRFLYQYMVDTDAMGLLDMQVMRDQKRVQNELGILAIKKTFELRVSYLQTRVSDLAWQYILHCVPQLFFGGGLTLGDNGGVLTLLDVTGYPTSPAGLAEGDLWSNGGRGAPIGIVQGMTPSPNAKPLYFGMVTAAELLALGGGNLPLTPQVFGSGQLYNNGADIGIS